MLRPQVERQELLSVYRDIDLPLAPVLAQLESVGIRIDTDVLAELSVRLTERIEKIAQKVFDIGRAPFQYQLTSAVG